MDDVRQVCRDLGFRTILVILFWLGWRFWNPQSPATFLPRLFAIRHTFSFFPVSCFRNAPEIGMIDIVLDSVGPLRKWDIRRLPEQYRTKCVFSRREEGRRANALGNRIAYDHADSASPSKSMRLRLPMKHNLT
jgi:hypothetical protein